MQTCDARYRPPLERPEGPDANLDAGPILLILSGPPAASARAGRRAAGCAQPAFPARLLRAADGPVVRDPGPAGAGHLACLRRPHRHRPGGGLDASGGTAARPPTSCRWSSTMSATSFPARFRPRWPRPEVQAAARRYLELESLSRLAAAGLCLAIALGLGAFSGSRISPELRARNSVERIVRVALIICSLIAIFTTIGIVISVLFESDPVLPAGAGHRVPVRHCSGRPQMAIRADQVGLVGRLRRGAAVRRHAADRRHRDDRRRARRAVRGHLPRRVRAAAGSARPIKPLLEVLAGIPTVVYGFFAALVVGPMLRQAGESIGLERGQRKRARRGPGDGRHDHPVRFLARRRHADRRAAVAARRFLRARRDPVRDHPPRGVPGRAARHRRRRAAGDLARDRRDHDRGDGGGTRAPTSPPTRSRR